jgi:hypothetical protein
VEYVDTDDSHRFIASECSIDGFTGKKLHRRLEALHQVKALRVEVRYLKNLDEVALSATNLVAQFGCDARHRVLLTLHRSRTG